MPEGDTVFRLAALLHRGIAGETLVRCELHGRSMLSLRRRVQRVFAQGKYLVIEIEGGEAICSHLGMDGSWHRYPADAPWQRPRERASVALYTASHCYVCFDAREVEVASSVSRSKALLRLGPDLLAAATGAATAQRPPTERTTVRRARVLLDPGAPVVDLLLDQRVAAGVGNVFKSEVLFVARCHPLTPVGALDDEALRRLFRIAAELLARSVRLGARRTVGEDGGTSARGAPLHVYGRTHAPCPACGTPIVQERLGRARRSTYWCPRCQATSGADLAGAAPPVS